jgi:hypothetical protein
MIRNRGSDGELDDAVWLDLSKKITVPSDLQRFEFPVTVYYASRLLQWEVGNGGFAQAAFNVPEWFELAAMGYRKLGKTAAESIILEVMQLLPENEEVARQLRTGEIEWEEYFVDHDFSIYDDRAYASEEWEIDAERIAYVRANREAFNI